METEHLRNKMQALHHIHFYVTHNQYLKTDLRNEKRNKKKNGFGSTFSLFSPQFVYKT